MLTQTEKQNLIKKYKIHSTDTGSSEVQIAILTKEIAELTDHLKKHPKDNHSRRGLLGMVADRKKLMDFLGKESSRRYNSIVKKLGLKK